MESLVIAPQWIGDAVMTEPLMRRLHARGERLTVGALPWVAPVYRAMPQVDEVIDLPFAHGGLQWQARRDMAAQLRGRFDAAYVCPNSLKSALLPWWANIAKRIGYHGESRWGLLSQRLPNPGKGERPPMVAFYSALSSESNLQDDVPHLAIVQERIDAVLAQLQLKQGDYVVMAPGAEYGSAKRWPARHFAALAAALPQAILLLGSGKEAAVCEEIVMGSQGMARNLAGKTTLDEALALIAGAGAMVSNDSGLMHVAAALRVPQVALFGSSSPLHTPPLSPQAQVVWLKNDSGYQPPLDCAPCFQRECPLGHTRCLVDIAPQDVLRLLSAADPA